MSAKNVQYVPLLNNYEPSGSSSPSSADADDDDNDNSIVRSNKSDSQQQYGRNQITRSKRNKKETRATIADINNDNDNHDHKSGLHDTLIDCNHSTILRDCATSDTTTLSTTDPINASRSVKDYHNHSTRNNTSDTTSYNCESSRSNKSFKKHIYDNCDNNDHNKRESESYRKRDRGKNYRKFLKYFSYPFSSQSSGSSSGSNNSNSYNDRISNQFSSHHLYIGSHRRRNMSLIKLYNFIFQKSLMALIGAALIHITLGTVYTLSNVNSYMTSYLRLHSAPSATYGGSVWIMSMNAVGQGIAMVMGGFIEKRFSARVSCFIGCTIHSMSIASTRWSLEFGFVPVVITYGLLPGFGTGLAYITPITNGFGWFPNRKGLVSGFILAGYGIGTFIFNMVQTAYVNPTNLSPNSEPDNHYFTQDEIMKNVPSLFTFMGSIYATMQFIGCCLLFKPSSSSYGKFESDELPIFDNDMSISKAIRSREFLVMYLVYGVTTQGVLFMNSMYKKYGQIYIADDMYLAWTGSLASIANCLGRLSWGMAVDRFNFTRCFSLITIIFGTLMFMLPFEFILSSKFLYLTCTLGVFGSFSGWFAIYPVHCARVFGRKNAGIIYGFLFTSQSFGGIAMAFVFGYLIDNYNRYVPCITVFFMEVFGLSAYHLLYPK